MLSFNSFALAGDLWPRGGELDDTNTFVPAAIELMNKNSSRLNSLLCMDPFRGECVCDGTLS